MRLLIFSEFFTFSALFKLDQKEQRIPDYRDYAALSSSVLDFKFYFFHVLILHRFSLPELLGQLSIHDFNGFLKLYVFFHGVILNGQILGPFHGDIRLNADLVDVGALR